MALTEIKTSGIADDAVTTDKLANAINTERTANTAKVSLGADSVTGAKIADDAVGAEHIEQLDADLSFADSAKAKFGASNDLEISHDGSNSKIHHGGDGGLKVTCDDFQVQKNDGSEWIMRGQADGAVELYHDNTKKFETTSAGVDVNGVTYSDGINMDDNHTILLGTSNDLSIFHDGSHSYVKDTGTGELRLVGNAVKINNAANNETMAVFTEDGSVDLYYNDSKKFETSNDGATVTGSLTIGDSNSLKLGNDLDAFIKHSGSDFTMTNNTGGLTIGNNSGTGAGEGHIIFKAGSNTECAKFTSAGFLKAKGNCSSYHAETVGYHEIMGDTAHDCTLKVRHNSSAGYGIQTLSLIHI